MSCGILSCRDIQYFGNAKLGPFGFCRPTFAMAHAAPCVSAMVRQYEISTVRAAEPLRSQPFNADQMDVAHPGDQDTFHGAVAFPKPDTSTASSVADAQQATPLPPVLAVERRPRDVTDNRFEPCKKKRLVMICDMCRQERKYHVSIQRLLNLHVLLACLLG